GYERAGQALEPEVFALAGRERLGVSGKDRRRGELGTHSFKAGPEDDREHQIGVGASIGGAELEIELPGRIGAADRRDRTYPQRGFAIALAEPGVARAPMMRL